MPDIRERLRNIIRFEQSPHPLDAHLNEGNNFDAGILYQQLNKVGGPAIREGESIEDWQQRYDLEQTAYNAYAHHSIERPREVVLFNARLPRIRWFPKELSLPLAPRDRL